MSCSAPADCAEIERRRATGAGLLADGGASRGNLLSGEAEDVILTVSRMEAEKRANPGYRAFFANGDNVTRTLVLFGWEVVLEWIGGAARDPARRPAARAPRRHLPADARGAVRVRARPDRLRRAHRHDARAAGGLRDVLELRRGGAPLRPRARRHAGGAAQARRRTSRQIERARRYAPRPYEIVVLSDHGQTQGATFKQRNGYGLDELVERSLAGGDVARDRRRRRAELDGRPCGRARPRARSRSRAKNDVSGRAVVVLGSGNLGLVYLMEERRRLTLEEIEERHPRAAARAPHPPARRLAARPLVRARRGRARRRAAPTTSRTAASTARTRSRRSRRTRRCTCCAPTASSTSPTSWSAASTTPTSRRGARSRS